jgi:hypothetical protein
VLGAIAQAFYGGWMHAHVVHVPCPAVLADIRGAYLWAYADQELRQFLIADHYECRSATREFQDLPVFDRATVLAGEPPWGKRLVLLCLRPRGSEWLPTRPVFRGEARLTLAPTDLQGATAWWWASDVSAGMALGGSWPTEIVQAVELLPCGVQDGLQPVRLPSGRRVDLRTEDLAAAIREERDRVTSGGALAEFERQLLGGLLRMLGTTVAFGNAARIDRTEVRSREVDEAIDPLGELLHVRNGHREIPGPNFDMAIAGAVTSWVRSAVTRTIGLYEQRGGTWLQVATDSVLFAATDEDSPVFVPCPGGSVKRRGRPGFLALPIGEVAPVLEASGAPWRRQLGFDRPIVGYVSGVNRFAMVDPTDGSGHATESALGGVYLDPTGTNRRTEDGRHLWAIDGHLAVVHAGIRWKGRGPVPDLELPDHWDHSAIREGVATSGAQIERLQRVFPERRVRPFTRFFQAVVDPRYSVGVVPIALEIPIDPANRLDADWRDQRTGRSLRLTTSRPPGPGEIRVRTMREVLELWRLPVDPTTRPVEDVEHILQPGLRVPVPVRSRQPPFELCGKEGDDLLLRLVDPGAAAGQDLSIYRRADTWTPILDKARAMGAKELATLTGLPERTARYVVEGRVPSPETAALVACALEVVGEFPARTCARPGCGARIAGRQRFCSDRCRKATARANDRLGLHRVGAKRCRRCMAVRYGDLTGPCPQCGGNKFAEVKTSRCPNCDVERVGDTHGPCPACGKQVA